MRSGYWIVTFIACLLIVSVRDIGALLRPSLPLEDAELFSYYYAAEGLGSVVRFNGGYWAALTELSAYAISFLPTRLEPHAYVVVTHILSALALSMFSWPAFRSVEPNDRMRAAVCLVLALMPLGNFAKNGVLTYMIWSLFFIYALVAAAGLRIALNTAGGLLLTLLLAAISWTNPLCVVLVPLLAFNAWRHYRAADRASCAAYVLLIIVAVLYPLIGAQRTSPANPRELVTLMLDVTRLLGERVVLESGIGTLYRFGLMQTSLKWAALPAALLILAALTFVLWPRLRSEAAFRRFVLASCYIAIVTVSASAYLRVDVGIEHGWSRRYSYIPALLFSIIMLIAAFDVFAEFHRRWRPLALGGVVVLALWLVQNNRLNNRFYEMPRADQPQLAAVIAQISAAEGKLPGAEFRLARERWPVQVKIR